MTDIDEHYPDSRSIERVRYTEASMELEVTFKNGGVYVYLGVPSGEVAALLAAESKGRYVAVYVKKRYQVRKA